MSDDESRKAEGSTADSFDALLRDAVRVDERAIRLPGTLVGGRYRLERCLGRGGMGVVYAATHVVTKKRFALKFVAGLESEGDERRKRFLREARAAAAVDHPAVVEVFDVFESEEGEPVMVMELLEGETLRDKLGREGALSGAETVALLGPVVAAVHAAHARGIVHRDLKPENIFLTRAPPRARVLDFGLASLLPGTDEAAETRLTRTGRRVGTAAYMAPEQAFGERSIDGRADVWSLGAILFECLTGRRLVRGNTLAAVIAELARMDKSPSSRIEGIPTELATVLDAMLVQDRTERLGDLGSVEKALVWLSQGPCPPHHWRRLTPGRVLIALAALAAAMGFLAFAASRAGAPMASPSASAQATAPPAPVPSAPEAVETVSSSLRVPGTPSANPTFRTIEGVPRARKRPAARRGADDRTDPSKAARRAGEPAEHSERGDPWDPETGLIDEVPF